MEVSDQIIKVLDDLSARFGVAVDWTAANVMPKVTELCGKYIKWEMITSIIWAFIGVLMVVSAIILFRYYQRSSIRDSAYPNGSIVAIIIGAALGIVGICMIGVQIFDIVRCAVSPELQIYHYIKFMASN